MRSFLINSIVILMAFFLTGCEYSDLLPSTCETSAEKVTSTENEPDPVNEITTTESTAFEPITTETQISAEALPEFEDEPYVTVNGNVPYFTDEEKTTTPFETYSELDHLGRCGVAFANICPEIMPTEERQKIGNIKPSGWHTIKYIEEIDGEPLIDGNFLYNRCHLIAFNLAGENDNKKNLITGTRYLNVTGMLPFEERVSDYVKATGNHVLYRVTPVFEGDDLLALGVRMEAWSVEDEGAGICFNVYCFNAQPYVDIDYSTGESKLSDEFVKLKSEATTTTDSTEEAELSEAAGPENTEDTTVSSFETEERDYVLNNNTMRVHLPYCTSVTDIAEHNKAEYRGTLEELKKKGYKPCGRCLAR